MDIFFWGVLLIVPPVLVLGFCEAGLRISGIMEPSGSTYVQQNPPPVETDTRPNEFNAAGWRDKERMPKKDPRTVRLLGIGDSITYGWSVHFNQIYLSLLEDMLNKQGSENRFEVMNASVPGWNILYEKRFLQEIGLSYEPDVVIIGFCLNDAELDQPPEKWDPASPAWTAKSWTEDRRRSRSGQTVMPIVSDSIHHSPPPKAQPVTEDRFPIRIPLPYELKNWASDHSHLYRFLRWGYDLALKRLGLRLAYPFTLYGENAEEWRSCKTALYEIGYTMKQRKIPVVLVIFPFFTELDRTYPWEELHRKIAAVGKESSMAVVDLLPYFKGRHSEEVGADPYYPNATGHCIAAEAIFKMLHEQVSILR